MRSTPPRFHLSICQEMRAEQTGSTNTFHFRVGPQEGGKWREQMFYRGQPHPILLHSALSAETTHQLLKNSKKNFTASRTPAEGSTGRSLFRKRKRLLSKSLHSCNVGRLVWASRLLELKVYFSINAVW